MLSLPPVARTMSKPSEELLVKAAAMLWSVASDTRQNEIQLRSNKILPLSYANGLVGLKVPSSLTLMRGAAKSFWLAKNV